MKRNNKNKKTYVAPLSKAIMLQSSAFLQESGGQIEWGMGKQGIFSDELEDDSESIGWDD